MENKIAQPSFLQSAEWLAFQRAFGRRTFEIRRDGFFAGLIEHQLPLVGTYLYCPRGPIIQIEDLNLKNQNYNAKLKNYFSEIIELAQRKRAGWVRFEPSSYDLLDEIQKATKGKIVKAPYDVQPRENFVLDITKSDEELLAEMKSKTRYNLKLAEKKGVQVLSVDKNQAGNEKILENFLDLTAQMAARQGIVSHPAEYYRKMWETFPTRKLKIYAAKYQEQIIAANLVLFHADAATYLHGASGDVFREVMAPHLLQWRAILDAKQAGYKIYDFGGIKLKNPGAWAGITKFKLGFSPEKQPTVFPGSYDLIVNFRAYALYQGLQKGKMMAHKFRKKFLEF